jgi:hypothetical protein
MTVTVSHVPAVDYARDRNLYEGFLDRRSDFDFERKVQAWLAGELAAGRAALRPYGDPAKSASGYFLRTTRGAWRRLAIRHAFTGGAKTRCVGQHVIAARL